MFKKIVVFCLFQVSEMFAQTLSSGQMKVEWLSDVQLGKGFDVIETFEVNNTNFLYCHNISSGESKIWNLNTGGNPVFERKTFSGWSSFVFFNMNDKTYMFEFKKETGHYQFYEMNADGGIGEKVSDKKQWSSGWSDFDVTYINGEPRILMMNASNGRAKVFKPYFD